MTTPSAGAAGNAAAAAAAAATAAAGAPKPPGANATRAQLISYYGYWVGQIKGKYEGTDAAYHGKSWTQVYDALLNADPTADPKTVADDVLGLAAAQGLGADVTSAISGTPGSLGSFLGDTGKAIHDTNFAGFLTSPLQFLQGLISGNLWIRVAKVAIGGIILAVGLAKLTGASNGIAGKAVKAAPLL